MIVGRCTSKVSPHGAETAVSFIESATVLVQPPRISTLAGPQSATGATRPTRTTVIPAAGIGHETWLVDRGKHVQFVENAGWWPQTAP